MNIEEKLNSIRSHLLEQSDNKEIEISDELDLIESGILDSLKTMILVVFIEKIRNKPIPIEQMSMDRLKTINLIKENFLIAA